MDKYLLFLFLFLSALSICYCYSVIVFVASRCHSFLFLVYFTFLVPTTIFKYQMNIHSNLFFDDIFEY